MTRKNTPISNAVIKRLPRYRRYLYELKKKNVEKISSNELSDLLGYTASQIRQDLNTFGGFGQQGYGYSVKDLYEEIGIILGLDKKYEIVIVGSGNLGKAVAMHKDFYKKGFHLCGMFDNDPKIIGQECEGVEIMDVENLVSFVEKHKVNIGIVCVPKEDAQSIADKLCFAGVKGIWNFAPIDIEVPKGVAVENVHLKENLYTLVFRMNDQL